MDLARLAEGKPVVKSTRIHLLVWVTVPDRTVARRIARAVLADRLAACVNVVPGVESHYWWKGKVEKGRELWLVMKTTRARLPALERRVRALHPYDTPECVATPLVAGNERYLAWIDASLQPGSGPE